MRPEAQLESNCGRGRKSPEKVRKIGKITVDTHGQV